MIGAIILGIVAGFLGRLLMPGRDPMGCLATTLLGIAGSFIGGFLQNLIQYHTASVHTFHPVGLIGSVIGAWVLLLVLRLTGLEPGRRRYWHSDPEIGPTRFDEWHRRAHERMRDSTAPTPGA